MSIARSRPGAARPSPGGRAAARLALAAVVAVPAGASTGSADEPWIEVASPHFTVRSDAGAKPALRVARQSEVFRAALRELWPWARVDPGAPLVVYAARSEASLRELLPSLPRRASGVFLSRGERHVLALRTDVPVPRPEEGSPFHVVYHEYAHFVLNLNLDELPPWLHEGLAEYLSGTLVEEDGIEIGRSIPWHRLLLRGRRLMPVAELLAVSRSPGYDEGDQASLFYAESWALVHCLMQADRSGASRLSSYLRQRRDGVADADATRRELGDPRALQRELEGYVRGRFLSRRLALRLAPAEVPPQPRTLDAAEVLAAHAELLLAADQDSEARSLIERALAIDPVSEAARRVLAGAGDHHR